MYRYIFTPLTLLTFLFTFSLQTFSQSSINSEVFNVYFHNDFESNTTGIYKEAEWQKDWNYPEWSNREIPPEIVEGTNMLSSGKKFMRWYLPLGSVGPEQGGGQWFTKIGSNLNEVYFSYNLRFKLGFEWVLSGKIPGLRGGPPWEGSGPPDWSDGFVSLLMWNKTGYIKTYYYHHDQTHDYGDNAYWNLPIETGIWYNITLRIVNNTIGANGGNNDGIIEGYINGKLVSQVTGLKLRNISTITIDQIYMACSFGGSGAEFAAIRDEWIDVDDFIAYTYKEGIDVPRGNVAATADNVILLPNYESENSSWPRNISASAVSSSKIKINWTNYSTSTSYFLERRTENETEYTVLKELSYGTISYVDEKLAPETKYYYRIKAGSIYSDECSAITNSIAEISPPTALQSSNLTKSSVTLSWVDNSIIETGFKIERTGPDNTQNEFSVGANVTSWTDNGLLQNSTYRYRIRAFNIDGYSTYTSAIQITTPHFAPPVAPSLLKSKDYTEKSITVVWNDNSNDENGFIITRCVGTDPLNTVTINVNANDTLFLDGMLEPNTTYIYTVKSVNDAGNSPLSNKDVAYTLSVAETKRVKDGLIAYYNFGFDPDYIIHDLSGYREPLNLRILNPSAVKWNDNNRLEVLSNSVLVSLIPAEKIISALNRTGKITIECWIRPEEPEISSNSRVISMGINDDEIGFVLDQNCKSTADGKSINYSVRMQTESTNKSGYPELTQAKDLSFLNLQHVVYVRDSLGNEILYINGEQVAKGFRPSSFGSWNNNFYLRLGNENDLNHSWKGTLYSFALYNKALSLGEIHNNFSAGPCDSIRNNGQNFVINVYPNPVTEVANIEVMPVNLKDFVPQTTIRVFDIYGKVFYQRIIFNPKNQFNTTLDFKNFAKGIYFIQIISGTYQESSKLIVQ